LTTKRKQIRRKSSNPKAPWRKLMNRFTDPVRCPPYVPTFGSVPVCYFFAFRTKLQQHPWSLPWLQQICQGVDVVSVLDPDLFQMTTCLAISFCGIRFLSCTRTALYGTTEGTSWIPSQAENLASVMFTFQVFDFFCFSHRSGHRTAVMMSHHVMAATVSAPSASGWALFQAAY
jgi:hypothetical protein